VTGGGGGWSHNEVKLRPRGDSSSSGPAEDRQLEEKIVRSGEKKVGEKER